MRAYFIALCAVHQRPETTGETRDLALLPPAIRSFTSETVAILRDGQTAQIVASTDPLSGDVLTVDVTLTVARCVRAAARRAGSGTPTTYLVAVQVAEPVTAQAP